MKTKTKALNNHKITYKWHYPATKVITLEGITHTVSKPKDGIQLLHSWEIIPELPRSDMAFPSGPPSQVQNSREFRNSKVK